MNVIEIILTVITCLTVTVLIIIACLVAFNQIKIDLQIDKLFRLFMKKVVNREIRKSEAERR